MTHDQARLVRAGIEETELLAFTSETESDAPRKQVRWTRRALAIGGAGLLCAGVIGVACHRTFNKCVAKDDLVALFQDGEKSQDLSDILHAGHGHDVLGRWLSDANSGEAPDAPTSLKAMQEALEKVGSDENKEKAMDFVKKIMGRAAEKNKKNRKDLKDFVLHHLSNATAIKDKLASLGAVVNATDFKAMFGKDAGEDAEQSEVEEKKMTSEEALRATAENWRHGRTHSGDESDDEEEESVVEAAVKSEPERGLKKHKVPKTKYHGERTPKQKANTAQCVFNILTATTQFAALATDINDAEKTCPNRKNSKTSEKICAVNLGSVLMSLSITAGSLSVAADSCAATMIPNVDALCAGAVTGLVGQVAELSGASALVATACFPHPKGKNPDGIMGWFHELPAGVTPSNIGQAGSPGEHLASLWGEGKRMLSAEEVDAPEDPAEGVTGRRLLFGGGKGADMTQCVISTTSIAWFLAQFGLSVNSAANPKAGATCPPRNIVGGKRIKGSVYEISQAYCSVDVSTAIMAFGDAIAYLELAVAQCMDELNLRALCGAGVDGILTAFAGIAASGSAMNLACDRLQDPLLHKAVETAADVDDATDGFLTKVAGAMASKNMGRRLEAASRFEEKIEQLKLQFDTPQDVWASLGWDINDMNNLVEAAQQSPSGPQRRDFVELMEERTEEKQGVASLFGDETCQ